MLFGRTLKTLGMRSRAGWLGWGAGLGAGYGAFSNDTSVLGGAAMGFGMGAAGYPLAMGARGARAGWNRVMNFNRHMGIRAPISAGLQGAAIMGGHAVWSNTKTSARMFSRAGIASGRFIARTSINAYNRIRGLGSR